MPQQSAGPAAQRRPSNLLVMSHQQLLYRANVLMLSLLFCGYVLTTGMDLISSDAVKTTIRALVLLAGLSIISVRHRISVAIFVLLFAMMIFLTINQNLIVANILFTLVLIVSFREISNRQLSLAFFIASCGAITLHILAVAAGMAKITSTAVDGRVRSALGFANANQFALVYLTLVCAALLVHLQYRSRWSLLALIGTVLLSLRMMQIADSRTSMASLALLVLLLFVAHFAARHRLARRIFAGTMATLPFLGAGVTFFLAANTSPLLNVLLSLRPRFFQAFLADVTPTQLTFGWAPPPDFTIDNGYLVLLSAVGLPAFVVIMASLSWRLAQMRPEALPIAATVLIASVFESFALRPEILISVMFFALLFRRQDDAAPQRWRQAR